MIDEICSSGILGFFGDWGVWSWIIVILNLIVWVGLIAGLALLVVWAVRRGRFPAATATFGSGQPTANEILRARYARGELTREQFKLMEQNIR